MQHFNEKSLFWHSMGKLRIKIKISYNGGEGGSAFEARKILNNFTIKFNYEIYEFFKNVTKIFCKFLQEQKKFYCCREFGAEPLDAIGFG